MSLTVSELLQVKLPLDLGGLGRARAQDSFTGACVNQKDHVSLVGQEFLYPLVLGGGSYIGLGYSPVILGMSELLGSSFLWV